MNKAIFIPILLFVSFICVVYFILPEYSQIQGLNDQIAKKTNFLQRKKLYFQNLKERLAELEDYEQSLNIMSVALPEDFSLPSLLSFFYDEALKSGMILKSIDQSDVDSEEDPSIKTKQAYFNIVLDGTFASFDSFLNKIESSSRIIETQAISLKESGEQLPEFNLQVKVYYR